MTKSDQYIGTTALSLLTFLTIVPQAHAALRAPVTDRLAALALPFIENAGQADPRVAYYASTFAGSVFVTRQGEIVYALPGSAAAGATRIATASTPLAPGWTLVETFIGGHPVPTAARPAATNVSVFTGNAPNAWRPQVPTYTELDLGAVWPGIEVTLKAYGKQIEKVFTVEPGTAPEMIRMRVAGAQALTVSADGALAVHSGVGEVRLTPPVAYQETDGTRRMLDVRYALAGDEYGFWVSGYDPSRAIIIDPLLQATYLGGSGDDIARAVAIDPSTDEVYVAGYTGSTNFPGTSGGAQSSNGGGSYDVFVARLSPTLIALDQVTYLGGSDNDIAFSLAIQPTTGEVYVAGETRSTNFPGTSGGAQSAPGGGIDDVFVARLNPSLTTLNQATYLGGSGFDVAEALAIRPSTGEIYIAGATASTDFPGTSGGAQTASSGGVVPFVARLNTSLTALDQATYLGSCCYAYSLAVHPTTGEVYVGGYTISTNFPGTSGGAQSANGGGSEDGYVARLNPNLTALDQATYIGGSGTDYADALAIQPATGEVYVGGLTDSTDFPGTSGGAQSASAGNFDAFVARLNGNLTVFNQTTYLGGFGPDEVDDLAIEPATGEVYVAGYTGSNNFPGTSGGAQSAYGGLNDAVIARLNPSLTALDQATYLGDTGPDRVYRLAISSTTGDVYVAGVTSSTNFPGTSGGAQSASGGGSEDAFVARLSVDLAAAVPPTATPTATWTSTPTATRTSTATATRTRTPTQTQFAITSTATPTSATTGTGTPSCSGGALDFTFGSGGKVTTAFGSAADAQISALVLQPDGKLVAAGHSTNGSDEQFALARYEADGALDVSFGLGGKVTTAIGSSSEARALVMQSDGKLVAAGSSYNGSDFDFALVRYNADGSLDSSFGAGGIVTTPVGSYEDRGLAMVVQPDDKLVIAGYSYSGSDYDFAVVRYTANGSLDSSFGTGGKVTISLSSADDYASALVLQPDGKLVAAGLAGFSLSDGSAQFALVRYNADGTLDNTFGSGGQVTTAINTFAAVEAVVLQSDGKLVAAGYSAGTSPDPSSANAVTLARYNADGSLDATFGSGGTVTTHIGSISTDTAFAVVIQPDAKLVAAGYSFNGSDHESFALVRYNADGSLDPTFGTGGTVTTIIGVSNDIAHALLLQPDGKLVAAGTSLNSNPDYDFALVRYIGNCNELLPGNRLLIKNPLSGPPNNKVAYMVRDSAITLGVAGSFGDPQCTGAGAGGTSNLRVGAAGGAGDITIPLPCSGWTTDSKNRLYEYKDTSGNTCKHVVVKNGVLVEAVCKGVQVALQVKATMSPVSLVLTLNTRQYCSEFGGTAIKDGSDGITLLRKNASAVTSCAPPPIDTATATPNNTPSQTAANTATQPPAATSTPTVTISPTPTPPATETPICGFVTKWGAHGSGNGQFSFVDPNLGSASAAIAVDASGNVYVADYGNHRIQKFTSGGSFITKWGSHGGGNGQFRGPDGVAVDGSGNVYVADDGNDRIEKFTSSGTFLTTWGSSGTGDGQLDAPDGVAVDASGNVYVVDRLHDRIEKFTNTGTFLAKWGSLGSGNGQFDGPDGIAADGSGNVYVSDGNDRIEKFTSAGVFLATWGSHGSGDGQFDVPGQIAVDSSGNVYVPDENNFRIQKFTSSGTLVTKWGSLGSGDGQFYGVWAVAADSSGNVYVAEGFNDRIQKFHCP